MVTRAAAVLVAALAAGCGGGSETRLSLPPGEVFAVTSTVSPRTAAFGDRITVGLRILMDRNRVDPDGVKVAYGFRPFRDRATIERVDSGNLTAILYRIELECLTLFCVPPEGGLSTARQWGARITTGTAPVKDVVFPDVLVVSRMPPQDGFVPEGSGEGPDQWPPRWRAAVSVPEPSFAASPRLLGGFLGGLGLLLVLGSAAGALSLVRRGHLFRAPEVSALDRALEQLRAARSEEERRAALEAVALALDADVHVELAEPARALAWSPATPSAAEAAELASLAEGGR